ncbi:MAG: flagellar assembly protein FliX, partial [Bosea sp. (in: a-proteobacteria)]
MFRIDPRGPVQNAPAPSQARPAQSGAGFQLPTASRTETPTRTGPVSMAGPLDTLVALQANEGAQERRKRQTKRGQDLLDGLDQLK